MLLAQAVAQTTEAGQGKTLKQPESGPDSQPESTDGSESESDSVRTDASGSQGCKSAQQPEGSDQDVIIIDEQLESDGLVTGQTVLWGSQADSEKPDEADWATRLPTRKPYINPRVVEVDDNWYQGEDCFDPSGIAPAARRAILPAADGTLALRQDAAMPGASRGCTKYRTHNLERKLS